MINDDDLDKLLSDVGTDFDFQEARQESLRQKQRAARKSDITIEEEEGSGSEENFLKRIKNLGIDDDILSFSNGLPPALNNHNLCSQRFKRMLSEYSGTDSIHQLIQKHKYAFLRSNENIEKLYSDFSIVLSPDALLREAKKNYLFYFEGFEEENKLDFLVLKELFIRFREFNSKAKKEWNELLNSISVFNLSNEAKVLFQELNSIINKALDLNSAADKFLRRIAIMLSIPEDGFDVLEKDIYNKILYRPAFDYRYEKLFDASGPDGGSGQKNSTDDTILDLDDTSGESHYHRQSPVQDGKYSMQPEQYGPAPVEGHSENITGQDAVHEKGGRVKLPDGKEIIFSVRGTSTWNTREPYIISINYEKLQKEYEDLKFSFYFISSVDSGPVQEGAIKRAMVRYLSDQSKNIENEYGNYIYRTIIQIIEEMKKTFDFQGSDAGIFIYHLGPMTIYRQIMSLFQARKTGICFKYIPGSKVVRFVPMEFIKGKVLQWFEENINKLNLEFDKIQLFEEIRRKVAKKYNAEIERGNRQLDELIARFKLEQNRQLDRDELFRSKWQQWFGAENIIVYKRFIDKTIFK